jgi:hypothetical protein
MVPRALVKLCPGSANIKPVSQPPQPFDLCICHFLINDIKIIPIPAPFKKPLTKSGIVKSLSIMKLADNKSRPRGSMNLTGISGFIACS